MQTQFESGSNLSSLMQSQYENETIW